MSSDRRSISVLGDRVYWALRAWLTGAVIVTLALAITAVVIYTLETAPTKYLEYGLIGVLGGIILPLFVGWDVLDDHDERRESN